MLHCKAHIAALHSQQCCCAKSTVTTASLQSQYRQVRGYLVGVCILEVNGNAIPQSKIGRYVVQRGIAYLLRASKRFVSLQEHYLLGKE